MAGQSTLSPFYRGAAKVFTLSFKDGAGTPIDITGHELWFTIRQDSRMGRAAGAPAW